MTARATRSGTWRIVVGSSTTSNWRSGARRLGALDRLGDDRVEAQLLDRVRAPSAPRLSSSTSSTSWVSSSSSAMIAAWRPARSSGGSRPLSRKIWMLLRSAAIGVRSSCDASAIRWRCEATDCSSASSVRLKLDARRASSSVSPSSKRSEPSRAGHRLGAVDEAPDRRQRCAADERAHRQREQDAGDDHRAERVQQLVQDVVDLGQRPCDLDRDREDLGGVGGRWGRRHRVDAQVLTVDRLVEERVPTAVDLATATACLVAGRPLPPPTCATTVPSGVHDLEVAPGLRRTDRRRAAAGRRARGRRGRPWLPEPPFGGPPPIRRKLLGRAGDQRAVDLAAQVRAHARVDDRCQDQHDGGDTDRHGAGDPAAQAHPSRST